MRCEETRKLLSPLLDGEVSGPSALDVIRHLKQCAECAAAYTAYKDISAALKQELAVQAPQRLRESLVQALYRENSKTRIRKIFFSAVSGLAAAVMLVSVGLHMRREAQERAFLRTQIAGHLYAQAEWMMSENNLTETDPDILYKDSLDVLFPIDADTTSI